MGFAEDFVGDFAGVPSTELEPGLALAVQAPVGGGALSWVSDWVAEKQFSTLVIDCSGVPTPHPWCRSNVHVVVPSTAREGWWALDLALKSGAFELVVSLDLPRDPHLTRYASRIRRALAKSTSRLLLVGAELPFSVPRRASIQVQGIEWHEGPLGDAPIARVCAVDVVGGPRVQVRVDVCSDCVRPVSRAPDVGPSPGAGCEPPKVRSGSGSRSGSGGVLQSRSTTTGSASGSDAAGCSHS